VRVLDIVAGTADPAFATTEGGEIVGWNAAATRLLGFRASRVVGRKCYEILSGLDAEGERICHDACPWVRAARRCEPVTDFEVLYRGARGATTRARVSALVVPGEEASQLFVVHLLAPVAPDGAARGPEAAAGPAAGEPPASGGTAALSSGASSAAGAAAPLTGAACRLTPREREVLSLMAAGVGTRDVAARLAISSATVRNHVQRILRKLGVHTRRAALAAARRAGLA
jgi:DNA-binding CsgD family transcriptional regulator